MEQVDYALIKVLVADDDRTTLVMMKKYLDQLGCTSVFATNGKEAVDFVRKYCFDICFMDIFMPEMGGVEAAEIIREKYDAHMPILAITAFSMHTDQKICEDAGMNDFITKPVSFALVEEKIAQFGLRNPKD